MNPVSPRRIALFADNAACLATLEGIRWADGHSCPRCGSRHVRRVTSQISQNAFFCRDCRARHNPLTGTIFTGVKLSLASYFQFFTIFNALGDTLTYKDIAFAIGAASASTYGVVARVKSVDPGLRFTAVDRQLSNALRLEHFDYRSTKAENFFAFCDRNAIIVDANLFLDYLTAIINAPLPASQSTTSGAEGPRMTGSD